VHRIIALCHEATLQQQMAAQVRCYAKQARSGAEEAGALLNERWKCSHQRFGKFNVKVGKSSNQSYSESTSPLQALTATTDY
jgi:hypothetical protein